MSLFVSASSFMDRLVTPNIRVLGSTISRYKFFVITGLITASTLAMILIALAGASHITMLITIFLNVAVLFTLAMLTKIIFGQEEYTFYHYMISVLLMSPVILYLMGKPVFPYEDIMAVGVILNLAIGRLGCFMVGCCHGIPCSWGVSYNHKHARSGFTPFYLGVRLFPLQLLEFLLVLAIVLIGVLIFLQQLPGDACSWVVISYGLLRYVLEYFRGDPGRPYLKGFSEAQWTSLAMMVVVVVFELIGKVPLHAWHAVITTGVALSMIVIAVIRNSRPELKHLLWNPNHIQELSGLISQLSSKPDGENRFRKENQGPKAVRVSCTSLGMQISMGRLDSVQERIHHYSFSFRKQVMSPQAARSLADLILRLWYPSCTNELIDSKKGIYHLVIHKQQ